MTPEDGYAPVRRREKRPSYGRFGSNCDYLAQGSPSSSTFSASNSMRQAKLECKRLEVAKAKHNHLNMLISQCIALRKMRLSIDWPPLILAVDRKLAALQERLDGVP